MTAQWNKLNEDERDSMVASKVMEWTILDDVFGTRPDGAKTIIPSYTTCPTACAVVKEKFPSFDILRRYELGYEVTLYEDWESFEGSGETECEAFCIAALRARGVEVVV